MRVIEKNMNTAIRNGKDFRSGNTSVTHSINDRWTERGDYQITRQPHCYSNE